MQCRQRKHRTRLCALYCAALQAGSANMQTLRRTAHLAFYVLYICIPHMVGSSVRVADIVSEMCTLTTNITSCHLSTPPSCITVSGQNPQRSYISKSSAKLQAFFLFNVMPTNCFVASQLPQFYEHSQSAEMLAAQAFRYLLMFGRVPNSYADSCKHDRHMSF